MKRFNYMWLKDAMIPARVNSMTNVIYALRQEEESKKQICPDVFTELQKIAKVQSVKASNAIEGIITTDKRIEAIVNRNVEPLNHSEKEIAGYKEALNLVHTQYENISFNEETVLNLHRIMLEQTEYDLKGVYKKEDNVISEKYEDGTSRVRYVPTKASETKEAMEQMFLAYMEARDEGEISNLLLIPCVILDFLCIHPFQDGNGRVSRLLSLLLMYKSGFDVAKYISFEEQINNDKGGYYDALKDSSVGWHDNINNYMPFIENFLLNLYRCYKEMDKRLVTVKSGKVSKNSRIESIIFSAFLPISKAEIKELLPDISITTIEKVLADLLKAGKIQKIGNTINTKYLKK